MSSESCYNVIKHRLHVLALIKSHVIDSSSPTLTKEVTCSAETIMKSIKSSMIQLVSNTLYLEIIEQNFENKTDNRETILEMYKFDELLFKKVMETVFNNLSEEVYFYKNVEFIKSMGNIGAIIEAFHVLHSVRDDFLARLNHFANIIKKFVDEKENHLKPEQKRRLMDLAAKSEGEFERYLKASALLESISDM